MSNIFKKSYSKELLIFVNLIPIFGVLFWDWSLFNIMVLFWSENIVIGFFNIFKIILAKGQYKNFKFSSSAIKRQDFQNKISDLGAFSMVIFFLFHYGMFTLGHGVFVFAMFGQGQALRPNLIVGFIALFISHGFSFLKNFIGAGEYKKLSKADVFSAPYKRVIILHVTIIFGGFAAMMLGSPVYALLFLVVLKISIDLIAHKKEHSKRK